MRRVLNDLFFPILLLAVAVIIGVAPALVAQRATAQTSPSYFSQTQTLAAAVTASGAASSSRGVNVDKTYFVSGSTGSGTGTAVVNIQGSNNASSWVNVGTVTLSLSTTETAGAINSSDRFLFIRPNASTLTGTTATYTATMSF